MMMGKIVPPQLEPRAMMPSAIPSLCLNQCAGQPMRIPNIVPAESYSQRQLEPGKTAPRHSHP